jgi:hypothetical protein
MDDQSMHDGGAAAESTGAHTAGSAGPARPKRSWRRIGFIVLAIVVLLPVLLFVVWTEIALHSTYSAGNRVGYVQKFSQKGWICKTWEGDMAMSPVPGTMPEHFFFSVRSDSVAHEVTRMMGAQVTLTYQEHRGVPSSCFGETQYHVIGVKRVTGP